MSFLESRVKQVLHYVKNDTINSNNNEVMSGSSG